MTNAGERPAQETAAGRAGLHTMKFEGTGHYPVCGIHKGKIQFVYVLYVGGCHD
jgi:hypothetical protein